VLTDSKPCVEAVGKLRRGEFSYSPRVTTFLSAVSQFPIDVKHISGKHNISTDFASRHPLECHEDKCQICSFIHAISEEPVINTSTLPQGPDLNSPIYTSRQAWSNIQSSCRSLRRVFAHLRQGTRPSKKETDISDIKAYLSKVSITTGGLLVVPNRDMFGVTRDRIVVPRKVVHGLATAIHLKLNHPSRHQLKTVFSRYFFALGMDTVIQKVTEACDQCASLKCQIPVPPTFTTEAPPQTVFTSFAADVMKRARQNILVVRENSTSYTCAHIIPDETSTALRDGLISLCTPLRLLDGSPAVIRCDPAPGFQALVNDPWLKDNRLQIEIGEPKNINKNPVAERAIQEVRAELSKSDPLGQPVSPAELAVVMARVNAKIRTNGLSSREYLQQRDQFSGEQLPMSDRTLLKEQHHRRRSNHKPSIKSKSPRTKAHATAPSIAVGDLVYLNTDRDKTKGRNRYLVTNVEQNWIHVSKFTGHQLRSKSYKVRPNQCYLVPNQVTLQNRRPTHDEADSDSTDTDEVRPCPEVTDFPVPDPPPDFLVPPDPPPVPEPPPAAEPHLQPATPEPHPPPRHSKRTVRPPPYLQDYVM